MLSKMLGETKNGLIVQMQGYGSGRDKPAHGREKWSSDFKLNDHYQEEIFS